MSETQLDRIEKKLDQLLAKGTTRSSSSAGSTGGGLTLPNYGRSKGQPVYGASLGDLEFYANGCRRTLDDASKARWHDKERSLLAAIEAEIARQNGDAPPTDEDYGRPGPGPEEEPF